jgi:hypothetical protein
MNGTRLARNLSAGAVAGIAAIASYEHMRTLAGSYGQATLIANLMPLSVDGLIIVSAIAMADDKRSQHNVRWSARVAFVTGVCASIAANVLATPGGLVARLISAWPAVSLLMVVEVLSRRGKATATTITAAVTGTVAAPVSARGGKPAAGDAGTGVPVTPPVKSSPARADRPRSSHRPPSADKVAKAAAKMPDATAAQIAAKAGVSEATARRHLRDLKTTPTGVTVASPKPTQPAETPLPEAA